MAKTALEKQLDKIQRENRHEARKEARRIRASSIVSGQDIIQGLRLLDKTAEEVLRILLDKQQEPGQQLTYADEDFPDYLANSIELEIEKLVQYGMISIRVTWDGGGIIYLLPPSVSYFEDKETALKKQEEQQMASIHIGSINNSGNFVLGDAVNSTFSIDNSVHRIENEIEEKGGEDKAELLALLEEVKKLMENIETSRTIPKQKGLFSRISAHLATHGWFYGEIVALIGQQAIALLNK